MTLFEELRHDVGFGPDDEAMLVRVAPLVEAEIARIVDHFYEVIWGNPTMKAVFEDDAQIARQKKQLARWLRQTFEGSYGPEFVEARRRVGKVHVTVGLEQRFMFTMMSIIRTDLIELALDRGARAGWPAPDLHAACLAINRILDLDLAIMLDAYKESYVEKIKHHERLATLGQMAVTIREEKSESTLQSARAEALAAIGTLTAGLAHEIRNPLNAAKLQLEVLARRAKKLDPKAAESILGRVRIVHTEIDRLNSMLNDFLGLARPEEVAAHVVNVHELFDEIRTLEEPLCIESGVELIIGCHADIEVTGDRHRLKQVFENLVNNARQAIEDRGGGGKIWLECDDLGAFIRLRVRDDGPGFGMDANHLAQPFVTTKPAGTGLGLSIVKKIAELHAGKIELANHPDGGACVDVTLPKRTSSPGS